MIACVERPDNFVHRVTMMYAGHVRGSQAPDTMDVHSQTGAYGSFAPFLISARASLRCSTGVRVMPLMV